MDALGLDDGGEYVCNDTGNSGTGNPHANTSFSTFCMHGFDSDMEFVLGIRSDHEFWGGTHVEFWHAWYAWGLGRGCDCIM